MARVALDDGATGVWIEGDDKLRAVRATVSVQITGTVKRDLPDTPVRIIPSVANAVDLVQAGADTIAHDGTSRPSIDARAEIVQAITDGEALAMENCSTESDARTAQADGAAIIGTTLSGCTDATVTGSTEPDLVPVETFAKHVAFVMEEGRYNSPDLARHAIAAGADCVTAGSVFAGAYRPRARALPARTGYGEPRSGRRSAGCVVLNDSIGGWQVRFLVLTPKRPIGAGA